jgi:hypothetical protein
MNLEISYTQMWLTFALCAAAFVFALREAFFGLDYVRAANPRL